MTKTRFTLYRAKDGFRWRAKRAGRIVADSGESYVRDDKALRSLRRFIKSLQAGAFDIAERL